MEMIKSMSILSDARQLCEDLPKEDVDYHIKQVSVHSGKNEDVVRHIQAVMKMGDMFPELLAYAEKLEGQIMPKAEKDLDDFGQKEYWRQTAIEFKAILDGIVEEGGPDDCRYDTFLKMRPLAAKELDADLSSWHRITEEEKEAIGNTIAVLTDYAANCEVQIGDVAPLIDVLKRLIS